MPTTKSSVTSEEDAIVAREKENLVQNYGRYPLALDHGKGCHVCDLNNRSYLDFVSGIGVNALGHGDPRILKVMHEQIDKLIHCSNLYYHRYQGELAERLARISGLPRAFFANSGAEVVEGALKIAKGYGRKRSPGKHGIVAMNGSFAGRTLGSTAVTGQAKYREPFAPLLPGVTFVDVNDTAALEAAVNENTAGVVFEPVFGEGGLTQVERSFAAKARQLTRRHDAILIFDEIQCGLGRTGKHFAYQWWNDGSAGEHILPDVLVTAKPLAAGLPLAAIMATEEAASILAPGTHGTTFGGNALACRVAIEFLDILDGLLPQIRERGDYFRGRLEQLVSKHDCVKEVRGKGLMLGLELNGSGKWVVAKAQEKGLLINCTAETVLRFLPPYIIENEHIDELITGLDEILAVGPPDSGK